MKGLLFPILLTGLLMGVALENVRGDSTWVYTVQVSATVQASPAKITLNWQPDQYGANSYTVYRKNVGDTSWGAGVTLSGTASSYADSSVAVGAAYEYRVTKAASLGYTGHGYIYAGINAPMADSRGKVVLVVDNTYSAQLATELARLQSDLTGDGWNVVRRDVGRNDTPASVRAAIQSVYSADPATVKAVFLFGHVPIFRCGNLNIDGHQSRPLPADGYYGDMDGGWDTSTSYLPSDVELMVGRVDLANMPGNGAPTPWPSELEMLRNYLNKDHKWRHKILTAPARALMGNRFGDFGGQAFAASGFRAFEPLVGPGTCTMANEQDSAPADQKWSSMLGSGSYLWAYGCGGGSYSSMSGMGTHGTYGDIWSADIVNQDAKAVFFMMFGSWLGEWDSTDNIMRAVLATPTMGLTCSWAGRPHWYYHHMGLGEPIGYSARLSQNNNGLYENQVNSFLRGIHIALMGDPTLRLHQVAPPAAVVAASASGQTAVSWTASPDATLGYQVYRAPTAAGPFTRITSSPVSGVAFTDTSAPAGTNVYMVRAAKIQNSPSGTYTNLSQGVFANASTTSASPPPLRISVAKAPNGLTLTWPGQPGVNYRVVACTNLTSPNWTQVSGNVLAVGSTASWTDTTASANSSRFYRVVTP